jgi:hypothetical protein
MRYQKLARGINDKRALATLDRLIGDLETQKAFLHPKPEK